MQRILIISITLLLSLSLKAQFYSSGADPANIKWRQIKSETFKVVYPEEFEGEAKRFIAMLDSLYEYGGHSLEHTPKPINVLIHSRSTYSNGFVSWAPKRIEIYPVPHQDMLAQDWLQQLAIHEFRHVVQIDKLNRGFTKALTYPFGQQAIGAVLGLYAPLWFLEGDATLTETTLSNAGRGRRPSFEQEIRAQVLEKQIYHYDKAYFGSYKDYVPNHYHMGYLYVAGARYKYGADVWERALDESGRKSWSITPFNRGIKSVTGKNKVPLYNEVFTDWQRRWQARSDSSKLTNSNYLVERDAHYKSYRFPTAINDDELIAEVSGPGELNHFTLINLKTGEEKKLLITGSRNREPFSYNNNKIVWTELERHSRWDNQYFSVIRTYDLKTGKQQKITRNSFYKAPALSPDGKTIAVVHTADNNLFSIHLLNADNGAFIKAVATPNNHYPLTPSWGENGQLVMVLITPEGKTISLLNTKSEQWTDVSQPDFTEIRFPKIYHGQIYFTGSYCGIENIYSLNLADGSINKLTESKFGAAYTSIRNEQLYYQDYTSDGYLPASVELNNLTPVGIQDSQLPIEPYIKKLQADEKGVPQLNNLPTTQYTSKKYSKWNLFNFHSWAPAFVDIDNTEITTGVSAMSQNLLGTTFTTIGFNADQQFSREKYNFKFTHQAWWPVFDLEIKAGNEKQKLNGYFANDTDTFRINMNAKPKHLLVDFEMKLPLNLTRRNYSRKIEPSVGISYQQSDSYQYEKTIVSIVDDQIIEKEKSTITVNGLDIKSIDYSLFAYNLHRAAMRDVSSRFGQVIELSYRHTPFSGRDYGSIFGIHSRLYFPGIGRHHSIRIDNDWQTKEKGEQYGTPGTYVPYLTYSDYVRFPRGINRIYNDELYTFKGDYMMPLLNPDLNIPGVLYLKRITTNLFYDYSKATQKLQKNDNKEWITKKLDFSSMGVEVRGELHPFRFVFPMSLGYRYAYIPDGKEHYHEVLVSMGLSTLVVGK